jgi:hypothetical protein
MYVFVKLKDSFNGKKIETAIYVCGQWIYPGDNRWVNYPKEQLEQIENHGQHDLFIIKTQDEMNEIKKCEEDEIESIVKGQWRQSEKRIATITDRARLQKIQQMAASLQKNKIAEIVKDRLDELTSLSD